MKHLRRLFTIQSAKYIAVAAIGYVFDVGILIFLYEFAHVHYALAITGGFIVGLITQYVLSDKFVFGKSKIDSKPTEITTFAAIGVVGLGILNLFVWIFISLFGMNYIIAKVVSTMFVYIWNFLARRSMYRN